MRFLLLITAVSSVEILAAGRQINVSVCNLEGISDSVLSDAKAETELVFRQVGVEIVWRAYDTFPMAVWPARSPRFLVRLWNHKQHLTAGPSSLEVMGKAFVGAPGDTVADAYFPVIQAMAEQRHVDAGVLLGFVMAHELGHLLLGPGHTTEGVMQAAWGQSQMDALRQRRLGFTREGAERIRLMLGARMAARQSGPGGNE